MSLRRFFASALDRPWDPAHRFQTSWLLPPLWLAAVRALLGLYALATLLASLVWDCAHPAHGCKAARDAFSYFTVLTYWGLAAYLLVAAVHTAAHGLLVGRNRNSNRQHCLPRHWIACLASPPRPLQALFGFLYSSVVVFPLVVTVVYWGFLYTPAAAAATTTTTFATWRNVSQHALNAVFALVEIVLPRTALRPWLHLPGLLAVLALYLALAYVTRATKGFYVYRFLDPSSPAGVGSRGLVAAYIVGIAGCCCVVFCLVSGVVALRLWLTEAAVVPVDEAQPKGGFWESEHEMGNTKERTEGV